MSPSPKAWQLWTLQLQGIDVAGRNHRRTRFSYHVKVHVRVGLVKGFSLYGPGLGAGGQRRRRTAGGVASGGVGTPAHRLYRRTFPDIGMWRLAVYRQGLATHSILEDPDVVRRGDSLQPSGYIDSTASSPIEWSMCP